MKYTVYADHKEEIEKKLEHLKKKAIKYGKTLDWRVGDEYAKTVEIMRYDEIEHCTYVDHRITVAAVDYEINGDELIQQDGWAVIAKVEHGMVDGENHNMVKTFEHDVPLEWYSCAPNCQHCNSKRNRKVTFMCRNLDGKIKQVGKACLRDYTGIYPESTLLFAEVRDLLDKENNREFTERPVCDEMFPVRDVIGNAIMSIKKSGYVASSEFNSTKNDVISRFNACSEITDDAYEKADVVMEWLVNHGWFDGDPLLNNCAALTKGGWTKNNNFGYLSYLPVAYDKAITKAAREAARAEKTSISQYLGNIGDKVDIKVDEAKCLTSWETDWGITFLYQFKSNGNVIVWKTSKSFDVSTVHSIRGTVKAHNEFRDERQTELTRCKII